MSRRVLVVATLLCSFFLIIAPLGAARKGSDAEGTPPVAWQQIGSTGLAWEPVQDFESVTLVVAGTDGAVFRGDFPAGSPIFFDLVDMQGDFLPDGTYNFELRAKPLLRADTRARLEALRERGDDASIQELRRLAPQVKLVQSGTFTIASGSVVDPDLPEPVAYKDSPGGSASLITPKDQVILDDLIVDGSLCVGLDCVNGESFGFDTVRLKENNLRIHFDDTSNSASFPRNDWRIVANESSNGGLSRWTVEDSTAARNVFTIEAGADSNAIYVDTGGRTGFSTSTPVVELHVVDGDTPTLRLEQDGSSGFAPQTWDVAGNETNFFVRDVTNGSRLPFRIRPSADTDSIFVDVDGDVGLGTSAPDGKLHIEFDGTTQLVMSEGSTGGESADLILNGFNTFQLSTNDSEGRRFNLSAFNNGAGVGRRLNIGRNTGGGGAPGHLLMIEGDGGVQHVWPDDAGLLRIGSVAPDVAAKGGGTVVGDQTSLLSAKNILRQWEDPTPALKAVLETPVFDFIYKDGRYHGESFTGPAIVSGQEFFAKDRGKSLNEINAIGYLIESVKALHTEIEQLKAKLKEYEQQ